MTTKMSFCTCLVVLSVMIFDATFAGEDYPDSLYDGYDIVGSCKSYYSSYNGPVNLEASEGAVVYSMKGFTYETEACQLIFKTTTGRLFVNAEKMGLEGTSACLSFNQSSNPAFSTSRELATYCGDTLFQVNTTERYLKIQLVFSAFTDEAEFRLVVSPFFETDVSIQTFDCDDGYKISQDMKWDGHQNCPDNSDEKDAPALPCPSRMLSCGESGPCIAKEWKCDRIPDCPNAADEEGCVYKCPGTSSSSYSDYQLECKDKNGCYYKSNRCRGNSYTWCDDGSENMDCDHCYGDNLDYYRDEPSPGLNKYCAMTRTCMKLQQFCDGVSDCPDGADEEYTLCHPSIYWYWTPAQLAGLFIGFLMFVVVVIFAVAVVHKKCRKQVV